MSGAVLIQLLISLGVIAIVYLVGTWLLNILGLGEPWPKILLILVVILVLSSIVLPLLGYGRLWWPVTVSPP